MSWIGVVPRRVTEEIGVAFTNRTGQLEWRDSAASQLLEERPATVEALRDRFPGCLVASLVRQDGGLGLDSLFWRSRGEAEEATSLVSSVRRASWVRHVSESGGIGHVQVLHVLGRVLVYPVVTRDTAAPRSIRHAAALKGRGLSGLPVVRTSWH